MPTSQPIIYLPDNLASWPWPRSLNPHYEECKADSAAWLESFKAFDPKAQSAFNLCDFTNNRTGCDLMNMFFIVDEYTDISNAHDARLIVDAVMDSLLHPDRVLPDDESPDRNTLAGRMFRFWERGFPKASASSKRRFLATFSTYLESVVEQAADRDRSHIRDVDSYLENRRENIGAWPSFALLELDTDIPDEIMNRPEMYSLHIAAIDMLILGNDMCSYNVEQSKGDDRHNIVTILMHQKNIGVQDAMYELAKIHAAAEERFHTARAAVMSWPELDTQLTEYVDGLGNWVRANDSWSFESQRYFGTAGVEIERTRQVRLLPKHSARFMAPPPRPVFPAKVAVAVA
ncbi:terpenoid synthase [Punctularia strigosozonata HHB-11173 SS5]|uniref:terpenoid synthase n=1 Tax=Punctularia strigosozonata (strain HHB-11173) TaxID=741275 RepID=UPI0004418295|nr:terpenoid synthase [Punctularia strigosozonata HHB-11173 SS5]EIN12000.1 terpenoid synthase [Punctularia strigosozonata HHB-11173 SS5]